MSEEDKNIINLNIEDEAERAHKIFSFYVVKRTIPDLRDGLKPVQRRIIYSMYENGLFNHKSFIKSIKVVGEVLGKYHPHGSMPVYQAIVKIAQDFNNNYPLITPQGNFGSIDGDPAADSRYTEIKLSKIAELLLEGLEHNTVEWTSNFDNTLKEPCFLPSQAPMILINGIYGISVGVMSAIPPHNLGEVIDACLHILHNPDANTEDIMEFIKGPDFPTKGEISTSEQSMFSIYDSGRGSVNCRGKIEIEDNYLIITEIPFGTKKAVIMKEIGEERKERISEIKEVIDESTMYGIRIRVNVGKESDLNLVKQKLFKYTQMQKSIYMNFLVLNGDILQHLNITQLLKAFLEHKRNFFISKFTFKKNLLIKNKEKLELNLWCQEHLKSLITILEQQKNIDEIKTQFIALGIKEEQVDQVLNMRLFRLSQMEKENTIQKIKDIDTEFAYVDHILNNEEALIKEMDKNLRNIKNTYAINRQTTISTFNRSREMVPEYPVIVAVFQGRYILKIEKELFKVKRIANKANNLSTSFGSPEFISDVNNNDTLYCFTNMGRVFILKVNDLSTLNLAEKNVFNLTDIGQQLKEGEKIVTHIHKPINIDNCFVFLVTEKGSIAKISFNKLLSTRNGTAFLNTTDDNLVKSCFGFKEQNVIIASQKGKIITFKEDEIRSTGRNVKGVRGISLQTGDKVVDVISTTCSFFYLFTRNGLGKGIKIDKLTTTHRGTKGVIGVKLKGNDLVTSLKALNEKEDFMLLTNQGEIFRSNLASINIHDTRLTSGHKVINLNVNSFVLQII